MTYQERSSGTSEVFVFNLSPSAVSPLDIYPVIDNAPRRGLYYHVESCKSRPSEDKETSCSILSCCTTKLRLVYGAVVVSRLDAHESRDQGRPSLSLPTNTCRRDHRPLALQTIPPQRNAKLHQPFHHHHQLPPTTTTPTPTLQPTSSSPLAMTSSRVHVSRSPASLPFQIRPVPPIIPPNNLP